MPRRVFAFCTGFAVACGGVVRAPVAYSAPAASQPSTIPSDSKHLESAYQNLKARIAAHNRQIQASAYLMNSEHLFVEDDSLRDPVIRFSRTPGGLDFLFGKVLDRATTDDDLLVISEILVYFGGHHETGDDKVSSGSAAKIIDAIAEGRATRADSKFHAPVSQKIREAADKAMKNRK